MMNIITKLKQLFCKHSYEKHYTQHGFRIVDGFFTQTYEYRCKKCGKKVIDIKGLELFKDNENNSTLEQAFEQDLNKTLIDTLNTTIEVLQKQLEEKDNQICELTEIIKTQSQSINAANHAELADKLKLENAEQKEERESRSFWKRLFYKD